MFINASTKKFTLVNNAFPSHDVSFEHLLYYKMVGNVFEDIDKKNFLNTKTYSILICQSFPFTLFQSFHSNRNRDVGLL